LFTHLICVNTHISTVACRPAPLSMNDHIKVVINHMAALTAQVRDAVHDQESRVFFRIKGKCLAASTQCAMRIDISTPAFFAARSEMKQ
jgi:hypothetical protein